MELPVRSTCSVRSTWGAGQGLVAVWMVGGTAPYTRAPSKGSAQES